MEAGEPSDLWVFGYGSLMWRPGFPLRRERAGAPARLSPLALRPLARPSRHAGAAGPGARARPAGSCRVAFRVAGPDAASTLAYLREREQVTAVYVERVLGVTLDDGRRIAAVTYLVDRRHPQYAGRLPEAELVRLVRQGLGRSAPTRTTSATPTTSSSPWASPTRCSPASPRLRGAEPVMPRASAGRCRGPRVRVGADARPGSARHRRTDRFDGAAVRPGGGRRTIIPRSGAVGRVGLDFWTTARTGKPERFRVDEPHHPPRPDQRLRGRHPGRARPLPRHLAGAGREVGPERGRPRHHHRVASPPWA